MQISKQLTFYDVFVHSTDSHHFTQNRKSMLGGPSGKLRMKSASRIRSSRANCSKKGPRDWEYSSNPWIQCCFCQDCSVAGCSHDLFAVLRLLLESYWKFVQGFMQWPVLLLTSRFLDLKISMRPKDAKSQNTLLVAITIMLQCLLVWQFSLQEGGKIQLLIGHGDVIGMYRI